jgi:xanthine dehydrogenase YagR molybdenum-binding subunit
MKRPRFDDRYARYVNDSFADYLVPVNADTPSVEVILLSEQNDHINPAGAKGLGELGNVGTNAAVCNAILHATGQRIRKPPCGWNSGRYRKRDRFAIFPSIPERP